MPYNIPSLVVHITTIPRTLWAWKIVLAMCSTHDIMYPRRHKTYTISASSLLIKAAIAPNPNWALKPTLMDAASGKMLIPKAEGM